MANALKLTPAQVKALDDAARGKCGFLPRHTAGYGRSTIEALRRRGLLGNYTAGTYAITDAGRAALARAERATSDDPIMPRCPKCGWFAEPHPLEADTYVCPNGNGCDQPAWKVKP